MISVAQFINRVINEPWDKQGLHCWRLVCVAQKELYGRTLPTVFADAPASRLVKSETFSSHPTRDHWREVDAPEDGAIVLMSQGNSILHAGVYFALDGGGILHSDVEHGVVFDTVPQVRHARNWLMKFMVPK